MSRFVTVSRAQRFVPVRHAVTTRNKAEAERRAEYVRYIRSAAWGRLRKEVLRRAGFVCEEVGCGKKAQQVHHLTYVRYKNELPEDLKALCYGCHERAHPDKSWMKRDRARPLKPAATPPANKSHCQRCGRHRVDVFSAEGQSAYFCNDCGHNWTVRAKSAVKIPKPILDYSAGPLTKEELKKHKGRMHSYRVKLRRARKAAKKARTKEKP